MEVRALGRSGIELSRIVLGCGNFGGIGSSPAFFGAGETEGEAHALLDAAWEAGITAFDTADAYGGGRSERYLGSWLRAKGSAARERLVLTTKTFNPMTEGADRGLAPARIRRQLESSLQRLGVDAVADVRALRAQPVADVRLAPAAPVGVGRVERRDSRLPRGVEERVRLTLGFALAEERGRRADPAEVPTAEHDARHVHAAAAERTVLH